MIFTFERELVSDIFHRNNVVSRIQSDCRSRSSRKLLLNHPFHKVRYKILRNGVIDFDQGYRDDLGVLSPDDLVALYSYMYLSRHHAEAMSTFDRFSDSIESLLGTDSQVWVVDFGCGPGTAGLAFAEHAGRQRFHYLGIDRSLAMRREARRFLRQARTIGLIDNGSRIVTASNMFSIPSALMSSTVPINIVFVASYLFASQSLNTNGMSKSMQTAVENASVEKCLFIYLNSTRQFANRTYESFVGRFGSSIHRFGIQNQVIQYRRYASRSTRTARFVNDCLLLKGLK